MKNFNLVTYLNCVRTHLHDRSFRFICMLMYRDKDKDLNSLRILKWYLTSDLQMSEEYMESVLIKCWKEF